jgi:hypothetical protein
MQATIYVSQQAFDTVNAIKDLDYYDRANLCDDDPDIATRSGYHLKSARKMRFAALPENATIVRSADAIQGSVSTTMPNNLRGCIFDGAPDLPQLYAEIVSFWSGESLNTSASGAAYFQCSLNEYMVDLGSEPIDAPIVTDRLLSEGIVLAIRGISTILHGLSPEVYIEVRFPIDQAMVGFEPDDFRSSNGYAADVERIEHYDQVYLKVADILISPDPDRVYIDLLCNELIDYGYWY